MSKPCICNRIIEEEEEREIEMEEERQERQVSMWTIMWTISIAITALSLLPLALLIKFI